MEKQKMRLKKTPVFLLLLFVGLFLLWFTPLRTFIDLMSHQYSYAASKKIYEKDLTSLVLEKEYSAFLENALLEDKFQTEYFKTYFKIKYQDKKDFISKTYQLLKLGYSEDAVNKMWDTLSEETIQKIIDEIWLDIDSYLEYDYFKEENLERYKTYDDGTLSTSDIILRVNLGLDLPYYENPNIVTEFSYTMLVNKYNALEKDFAAPNIEQLTSKYSVGDCYLEHETRLAFEKMAEDMEKENLHVLANATYRNYEKQEKIYQDYFNLYGQKYVDKYVARAGFTEHSTGLCLDIRARDTNTFQGSKEAIWISENAHRYGFILRYPEGKENITGFRAEPWHYRYVGVEIATYIKEHDITFEEYYAMFLDSKEN